MNKALCVFAIGEKYKVILKKNITQFEGYAKKCDAKFIVINAPLDKTMKRSILAQKLLIPSFLQEYEKVVFLDLDVVISSTCPSLFDLLPKEMGLAAVCSPRGSDKYVLHYKTYCPRVLSETVETYFSDRNFPPTTGLIGNINGGVLVFNPSKVGELFKDYYYSDHEQGEHNAFEEAPMAYISQSNALFEPLDENFNRQVFYEMYTPIGKNVHKIKSNVVYKVINKVLENFLKMPYDVLLSKKLFNLRNQLIKNEGVHILHFSGKSLPTLYTKNLFLQ